MILQALVKYYEDLLQRGLVPEYGWSPEKVSMALYLDDEGEIIRVASTEVETQRGKKTVLAPAQMSVPAHMTRSSGVKANFLCDNSGYLLGFDSKGKPERSAQCFAAAKELHLSILQGCSAPAAKALTAFFEKWTPEKADECAAIRENKDALLAAPNLVFRYEDTYIHEVPEIRERWKNACGDDENPVTRRCLVTGNEGPIAILHPMIKGVPGAQSSGAALVSFNGDSFCSYGRTGDQGLNAPTSEYAASAYGCALNYLISDFKHRNTFGDTLCLCWATGAEEAYQDAFGAFAYGAESKYDEHDLKEMLRHLVAGEPILWDEQKLDPERDFYILGISPNAARLSVRFFEHNSFGGFVKNIAAHQERLEICGIKASTESIPIWKILSETTNKNARSPKPQSIMAGDLIRAIVDDTRYPASLLNELTLRIRAEHEINQTKAAMIKAYYLKNTHKDVPKEVLTVALNPESNNIPYNLGRLFAVLEAIQEKANPGINTTIKDKYFNSASAIPAVVFPTLLNLAQKHLRKIDGGLCTYFEKQLGEIMEKLGESYPARLSLPQQGAFQLGYYQQVQTRYQRKENKEEK